MNLEDASRTCSSARGHLSIAGGTKDREQGQQRVRLECGRVLGEEQPDAIVVEVSDFDGTAELGMTKGEAKEWFDKFKEEAPWETKDAIGKAGVGWFVELVLCKVKE